MKGLAKRRVAITGIGVVAPNGCDLISFWNTLIAGESAADKISRFDASELPTQIGCEVGDLSVGQFIDPKKAKRFERSIRHALVAARLAVADADVEAALNNERASVVDGISLGGMESGFKAQAAYENKGYKSMSPFSMISSYNGGSSAEIAVEFGIEGEALSVGTGSCSGCDAIGHALSMIVQDEADVVLAGGSETPLLGPVCGALCLAKATSTNNAQPQHAMRPFDRGRDGFVLGEGAAFLVLEEISQAIARGAKIYAELSGYGTACEARHSVSPEPDGRGVTRAIRKALRAAEMATTDVQYVNLHGTANESHDGAECAGIHGAFGDRVKKLSTSATKPVTGHALGASGALEAAITALAIHHREIPPTINHADPADGCNLDFVPSEARPYPLTGALNLNVGFGGRNSCLAFRSLE